MSAVVRSDRFSPILRMSVISITDKQGIPKEGGMWETNLQRVQVRPPQTIQNRDRLCVRCEDVDNEQRRDEKEEAAERDIHGARCPDIFCSGTSFKFTREDTRTWWKENGFW